MSFFCEKREIIVVVAGRAKDGLQKFFGKKHLPVIMCVSRVAFLIMFWAHKENHNAHDITFLIVRQKA